MCGKEHCRCAKPGGDLHGGYWYLFTKSGGEDEVEIHRQGG